MIHQFSQGAFLPEANSGCTVECIDPVLILPPRWQRTGVQHACVKKGRRGCESGLLHVRWPLRRDTPRASLLLSSQMFPGTGSCESCEGKQPPQTLNFYLKTHFFFLCSKMLTSVPVVLKACRGCDAFTRVMTLTEHEKSQQATNDKNCCIIKTVCSLLTLPKGSASFFMLLFTPVMLRQLQLSHWWRCCRPSAGGSLCPQHVVFHLNCPWQPDFLMWDL